MGRIALIGVPLRLQFSITAVGDVINQGAANTLGTAAVAVLIPLYLVKMRQVERRVKYLGE